MTRDHDDVRLDDATLRALRASGDLLPTSEAEVERAESSFQELELPERLRSYQPRSRQASQPRRPSRALGYVTALGLGALAAAGALLWRRPAPPARVTS